MNNGHLFVTNESLNLDSLQLMNMLSISPTQSRSNAFHLCNLNTYLKA